MIAAGQIALSLALHPHHQASFHLVLQGGLALVLGTFIVAFGMLGLAGNYERVAARLHLLLSTKQLTDNLDIVVQTGADLERKNCGFWKAYYKSALGLCLFMGGILGITTILLKSSFISYLFGLGMAITFFGLLAAALSFGALHRMRRTHLVLEDSAAALGEQPDIADETPVPEGLQRSPRLVLLRDYRAGDRQARFRRPPSQLSVKRY